VRFFRSSLPAPSSALNPAHPQGGERAQLKKGGEENRSAPRIRSTSTPSAPTETEAAKREKEGKIDHTLFLHRHLTCAHRDVGNNEEEQEKEKEGEGYRGAGVSAQEPRRLWSSAIASQSKGREGRV